MGITNSDGFAVAICTYDDQTNEIKFLTETVSHRFSVVNQNDRLATWRKKATQWIRR